MQGRDEAERREATKLNIAVLATRDFPENVAPASELFTDVCLVEGSSISKLFEQKEMVKASGFDLMNFPLTHCLKIRVNRRLPQNGGAPFVLWQAVLPLQSISKYLKVEPYEWETWLGLMPNTMNLDNQPVETTFQQEMAVISRTDFPKLRLKVKYHDAQLKSQRERLAAEESKVQAMRAEMSAQVGYSHFNEAAKGLALTLSGRKVPTFEGIPQDGAMPGLTSGSSMPSAVPGGSPLPADASGYSGGRQVPIFNFDPSGKIGTLPPLADLPSAIGVTVGAPAGDATTDPACSSGVMVYPQTLQSASLGEGLGAQEPMQAVTPQAPSAPSAGVQQPTLPSEDSGGAVPADRSGATLYPFGASAKAPAAHSGVPPGVTPSGTPAPAVGSSALPPGAPVGATPSGTAPAQTVAAAIPPGAVEQANSAGTRWAVVSAASELIDTVRQFAEAWEQKLEANSSNVPVPQPLDPRVVLTAPQPATLLEQHKLQLRHYLTAITERMERRPSASGLSSSSTLVDEALVLDGLRMAMCGMLDSREASGPPRTMTDLSSSTNEQYARLQSNHPDLWSACLEVSKMALERSSMLADSPAGAGRSQPAGLEMECDNLRKAVMERDQELQLLRTELALLRSSQTNAAVQSTSL